MANLSTAQVLNLCRSIGRGDAAEGSSGPGSLADYEADLLRHAGRLCCVGSEAIAIAGWDACLDAYIEARDGEA